MKHHVDFLQRGVEPRSFIEREDAIVEMVLFRELFDRDRVPACEDRFHSSLDRITCDQLARVTVGSVY